MIGFIPGWMRAAGRVVGLVLGQARAGITQVWARVRGLEITPAYGVARRSYREGWDLGLQIAREPLRDPDVAVTPGEVILSEAQYRKPVNAVVRTSWLDRATGERWSDHKTLAVGRLQSRSEFETMARDRFEKVKEYEGWELERVEYEYATASRVSAEEEGGIAYWLG